MILYHGTHKRNTDHILKNGIIRPMCGYTPDTVSLAKRYDCAFGYACMSGESAFRAAGKRAKRVPPEDRIVFIITIPDNIQPAKSLYVGEPLEEHRFDFDIPAKWISIAKF